MHGLSPGWVVFFKKFLPFESRGACAIGTLDGCTRIGGREGRMGVGYCVLLCLRHRTLSVRKLVYAPLVFIHRGQDVLSALCDFGTYLSMGEVLCGSGPYS